jgi:hypothetical protein
MIPAGFGQQVPPPRLQIPGHLSKQHVERTRSPVAMLRIIVIAYAARIVCHGEEKHRQQVCRGQQSADPGSRKRHRTPVGRAVDF